jgi:hypothetical protein
MMSRGMISDDTLRSISDYWRSVGVPCEKAILRGRLAESDLARLYSEVGLPAQDWWLFSFEVPIDPSPDSDALFGTVGSWRLFYCLTDGSCFEMDLLGRRSFVNSSLEAFARILVIWDMSYRRVQRECPGDTGEDFDLADAIVGEMKDAMREVDAAAFTSPDAFWPILIAEMAE